MTLADFKTIFFWEYVHRLLGRLIGLAFALPLLWFCVAARDPAPAMAGSSAACSRSARCRARSAGGWSPRAWSTGPRSAISGSPSTCSPRLLIFAGLHLGGARPARAAPRTRRRRPARMPLLGDLGAVPAVPAIPVRRLCRRARRRLRLQQLAEDGRGMVPGRQRRCSSRACATSPTIRSWSSSSTAGSPSSVAALALWLGVAAPGGGATAAEAALLVGAVTRPDPARHPHPAVGRPDRHRRRAPGHGGAAARRDGHRRAPARGAARHDRRRRSSASTPPSPATRRRGGSPAPLVEERLAACANILGPCHSIYRWQGKVEEADEVAGDLQDPRRRAPSADRADRRAAQLRRAGRGGLADRRRRSRHYARMGAASRSVEVI